MKRKESTVVKLGEGGGCNKDMTLTMVKICSVRLREIKIHMEVFFLIDNRIIHCLGIYLCLFLRRYVLGIYCK